MDKEKLKKFRKMAQQAKDRLTQRDIDLLKQRMDERRKRRRPTITDRSLLFKGNKFQKLSKGGLKGNQKAIASKAPPYDEIGGNDFAVLRKEKAKGRGMGLQDESVKPGKVMKAKMGVATDYKKYLKGLKKATDSVKKDKENKFIKRRIKLMGMPKLSKGGGADTGTAGERRSRLGVALNKVKRLGRRMRDTDRLTKRDIDMASQLVSKKMGGGMMNKPMGYKTGTSVKARGCKLGRTRPTKIT